MAVRAQILVLAALLAMGACKSTRGTDEVIYELAGTRWALMQLGGKPVRVSEGGREAYIVLNPADGRVVGFAGCNQISTVYKQHDEELSFDDVIATRMFCPDLPTETALLQAMELTAGWRIAGAHLELLDAKHKPLARFEARNL